MIGVVRGPDGRVYRVLPAEPPEIVLVDEPEPCPYLPGRTAHRPLRLPVRPLTRAELDGRLDAGDRRWGHLLYTQACEGCRACEPIRVDVAAFRPSRTQARIARAGDAALEVEVGEVRVDDERVALFNRHEEQRGLRQRATALDAEGYARFLVDSCAEGVELCVRAEGRLVAVAIADRGRAALSAVYTCWDPALARRSLGTYAILRQLRLCRELGLAWLYLGLYVAENHSMSYKARFLPHERLVDGTWRRFAR